MPPEHPIECPACHHVLGEHADGQDVVRVRVRVRDTRTPYPRIVRGRFDEVECERCGGVWRAVSEAA